MSDVLRLTIPGDPVAQGRPRFSRFGRLGGPQLEHPRAIDDPKSRAWKKAAARVMQNAIGETTHTLPAFPSGPLELTLVVVFRCLKGDERKRELTPARWKETKPDVENLAKAVMDAGTGILYTDDAQVARLVVDRVFAAQGDEPRVVLELRPLQPEFVPLTARLPLIAAAGA